MSVVTPASAMPHGTKRSYQPRSTSQLSANPCIVTPRLTRMPMARDLALGQPAGRSARSQTPLRPGTRAVVDAEVGADRDQGLLEPAYVVDHERRGRAAARWGSRPAGRVRGR